MRRRCMFSYKHYPDYDNTESVSYRAAHRCGGAENPLIGLYDELGGKVYACSRHSGKNVMTLMSDYSLKDRIRIANNITHKNKEQGE